MKVSKILSFPVLSYIAYVIIFDPFPVTNDKTPKPSDDFLRKIEEFEKNLPEGNWSEVQICMVATKEYFDMKFLPIVFESNPGKVALLSQLNYVYNCSSSGGKVNLSWKNDQGDDMNSDSSTYKTRSNMIKFQSVQSPSPAYYKIDSYGKLNQVSEHEYLYPNGLDKLFPDEYEVQALCRQEIERRLRPFAKSDIERVGHTFRLSEETGTSYIYFRFNAKFIMAPISTEYEGSCAVDNNKGLHLNIIYGG